MLVGCYLACHAVAPRVHADFVIDLGRGPVMIHTPANHDPATPLPLVMLLHGYSANGAAQEAYMNFLSVIDEFQFLYAVPNGTQNPLGAQFWNATDACCDFFGSGIDDSSYLRSLIESAAANAAVDARRIYIIGHSNGGSMAYRMACDHSDRVAAIVSFAGATFLDAAHCTPAQPVHVLHIHGTNDAVAQFNGGCSGIPGMACYPGAVQSVEQWVAFNGCALAPDVSAPPMDLDTSLPGAETTVTRYTLNCHRGGSGELWTIVGGAHVPFLAPSFASHVIHFLYEHPKPAAYVPGDVNGDGIVNVLDVLAVVHAFGPCPSPPTPGSCPADIAPPGGNGIVNSQDLLTVIHNYH